MTTISRRRLLDIDYNHKNIKEQLDEYLMDWTYTDNLSGQIDDLQLKLEDVEGLWLSTWFPTKGSTLTARIERIFGYKENGALDKSRTIIGDFEIDEISGGDSTITIMASALPQQSSLKGEQKSRSWEKVRPKKVYEAIAKANSVTLHFDSTNNDILENVEQDNETDLEFIYRFAREQGYCLKITNKSIVILDEQDYENKAVKGTISYIPKEDDEIILVKRAFKTTLTNIYRSCTIKNHITKTKKTITATFTPPNPPAVGRKLVLKADVKTTAEAQKMARKKLREHNKNADTLTLTVVTDRHIDAGDTYQLVGFGRMSGKYIVTQVQLTPVSLILHVRRCLEGY